MVLHALAGIVVIEARAHDPMVFGLAIFALVAAALLVVWIPARWAMRVDPMGRFVRPNSTQEDNYSSTGRYNPHTGKQGTKPPKH